MGSHVAEAMSPWAKGLEQCWEFRGVLDQEISKRLSVFWDFFGWFCDVYVAFLTPKAFQTKIIFLGGVLEVGSKTLAFLKVLFKPPLPNKGPAEGSSKPRPNEDLLEKP